MDTNGFSRRRFLSAVGIAGAVGTAGCQTLGETGTTDSAESAGQSSTQTEGQSGDTVYAEVYQQVVDAVVSIRIYAREGRGSQGSGFLIDDRHVVTNEHVVSAGDVVTVRFEETGWIDATVVGTDVYSDLAVLEVEGTPSETTPLSFVDSDPAIGSEVVAVGNPFGLSGSVSSGIVSGVNRTLPGANNFSIADAVQTDAAVNPGNSGGPLVDLDGNVVGVINAGGGDNVAFAISAALTQRVVPELIETGNYDHSYMGVALQNVDSVLADVNDLDEATGVYVDDILEGGPSEGVLQGSDGTAQRYDTEIPTGGDVIKSLNGTPTPTRQILASFLAVESSPGDTLDVAIVRDGAEQTVELTLGSRPEP